MGSTPSAPKPGVIESRMARAAALNSLSLREAARVLAAKGLYGPARSLLVLATEEMEKGQGYRMVADGVASFDPKDRKVLWVISEGKLRTHPHNQLASRVQGLALETFEIVHEQFRRLRGREPTEEEFYAIMTDGDKEVAEAVAVVLASPEAKSKIRAKLALLEKANEFKNAGFYTLVDGANVRTPSDVTVDEFRAFEAVADPIIDEHLLATRDGFPPEVAARLREDFGPRGKHARSLRRRARSAPPRVQTGPG